jgi:CO dehydrogenase maturation factor
MTFVVDSVRLPEREESREVDGLEQTNAAALDVLRGHVDALDQDWPARQADAVEFHRRNAAAWGSGRAGADLTAQIDPDFVPSPDLLSR